MKSGIVVLVCVAALVTATRSYAGLAQAFAGGSFAEVTDQYYYNEGALSTAAEAGNEDYDGSTYYALATVTGPNLHAYARASRADTFESGYPRSGAQAVWEDLLIIENPDLLLDPELQGIYPIATFRPIASGDGYNGSADLSASLTALSGEPVYKSVSRIYGANTPALRLSVGIDVSVDAIVTDSVVFRVALSVGTKSTLGEGDSAKMNFYNTAYLPPILITDSAGNPIPKLAGLRIVGSGGWQYPVTTVLPTPGDYNSNGTVDAADYVVWRKMLGEADLNNGDPNGTVPIGPSDYTFWRSHFGNTGTASGSVPASAAAVPEPATAWLILLGATALFIRREAAV